MKTQTTTASTRSAAVSADRSEASESRRPSKRVAARFVGIALQAAVGLPARERGDLRAPTLELFKRTRAALYSVEVARELKCSVSRAVYYLRQLENSGELVSMKELSPVSGQGRRVYRLATPQSRQQDQRSWIGRPAGFETLRYSNTSSALKAS